MVSRQSQDSEDCSAACCNEIREKYYPAFMPTEAWMIYARKREKNGASFAKLQQRNSMLTYFFQTV